MIAEGDKVMCLSKRTGTHTGEFHGISPTGNTFTVYRFWSFRIENGKIADMWGMDDQLGQYQQLGVLPPGLEFIQAYKESLKQHSPQLKRSGSILPIRFRPESAEPLA